jgi:hypothetical protein
VGRTRFSTGRAEPDPGAGCRNHAAVGLGAARIGNRSINGGRAPLIEAIKAPIGGAVARA